MVMRGIACILLETYLLVGGDIKTQQPIFVIKIPSSTVRRIVGPRIKAVKPGVFRGDRKFLNKYAVLIDAYGRIKPSSGCRVWNAVAYNQSIGPLASCQFDILSGFGELNACTFGGFRFNGEWLVTRAHS